MTGLVLQLLDFKGDKSEMFEILFEKMKWYPWMRYILESYIKGDTKERLVLQPAKKKELSLVLNGPSAKRTVKYLDPEKTDVMMVNLAPLTPLYKELKPKYLCICDSCYTKKMKRNFSLKNELLKMNEDITIFLPHYLKDQNIFSKTNLKIKYVFSPTGLTFAGYDVISYKLMEKNLMVPEYNNICIMAIYVAIQLGYKKIYLYGADENFVKEMTVDDNNRIMRRDDHYYGKGVMCESAEHGYDMEIMMYMMYRIFNGLKKLKKYADKENVSIINMSDDSWIDCFKRYKHTDSKQPQSDGMHN